MNARQTLLEDLAPAASRLSRVLVAKSRIVLYGVIAGLALIAFAAPAAEARLLAIALAIVALAASMLFAIFGRRGLVARDVARRVEKVFPSLDSRLVTAVDELESSDQRPMSVLQRQLVDEVTDHARTHDWSEVVPRRQFVAMEVGQLAAMGLAACLISVLLFRTVPAAPVPVVQTGMTGTRSLSVTVDPGNCEVERGQPLLVTARFPSVPSTRVELVLEGESGRQTYPMEQSLDDPLFAARIPNVTSAGKYWLLAEGLKTDEYQVAVYDLPAVESWTVHIDSPSYTNRERQTEVDAWDVVCVEGSTLELECRVNVPLAQVALEPAGQDVVAATLEKSTEDELLYRVRLQPQQSGKWTLVLRDAADRRQRVEPTFEVAVLPNRRPDLRLAFPAQDTRVSPLEELTLEAQINDDFAVLETGVLLSIPGQDDVVRVLTTGKTDTLSRTQQWKHLEALEQLGVAVDDLIAYVAYADDIGPDGQRRRTTSDMFFAEVRPFEETFRQDKSSANGGQSGAAGGSQSNGNRLEQLVQQQKQVVTATWNLAKNRRAWDAEAAKAAETLIAAQDAVRQQFSQVGAELPDPKVQPTVLRILDQMETTRTRLRKAVDDKAVEPLNDALKSGQTAYQGLLKLRARDHRLQQGQQSGAGAGGGSSASQQQMEQLELTDRQNRYEQQRAAESQAPTSQRAEELAILDRLKDLARRQEGLTERLKEVEAQLRTAKTEPERQELLEELKRLRDEQQRLLQDADRLRTRINQSQPSEQVEQTREQLEQTRRQMVDSTEALREGRLSQAINSGTRAAEELNQLQNDFRRQSAARFAEAMREMRGAARDLMEREKELAQGLEQLENDSQRTLRQSQDRRELQEKATAQRENLEGLLNEMRKVVEESEQAEPLLSQQLYDAIRSARDSRADDALNAASQLIERGFLKEARAAENQARQGIDKLSEAVDGAAESILGDEVEGLRRAREQLAELSKDLNRELAAQGSPDGAKGERSAEGGQPGSGTGEPMPGEPANGEGGTPSESKGQPGQSSKPGEGGQPGQSNQPGQPGSGSQPSNSPGDQPGKSPSEGGQPSTGGQPGSQPGQQPGGGQQPGAGQQPGGGQRPGGQQPGLRGGPSPGSGTQGGVSSGESGGGGQGGPAGSSGPFAGNDFVEWADRLRDVETAISDPDLQNQVARVRERARSIRAEAQRHAQQPNWELVRTQVQEPLLDLQNRIAEEIARRTDPESLTPVDRDPVPTRYRDLVRSYYERLGQGTE